MAQPQNEPTAQAIPNATTPVPIVAVPAPTPTATINPYMGRDGYAHLTPAQLVEMLQDKDFLLINTHMPYGVEIAQTDAHIPIDDEGLWLSHYPTDKAAKIVLYCRSGRWSTVAAKSLVELGYTNIWHLDGGMVAWQAARLPFQKR